VLAGVAIAIGEELTCRVVTAVVELAVIVDGVAVAIGFVALGFVALGFVALAVASQVDGDHPVTRGKVLRLGREIGVVAAPAVYEDERRIAGARLLVVQLGSVAISGRHLPPYGSGGPKCRGD